MRATSARLLLLWIALLGAAAPSSVGSSAADQHQPQCSDPTDAACAAGPAALSKEQLSKLTAKELKALLKKLGLEPKGTKKMMLARLLAADEGALATATAEQQAAAGDEDAEAALLLVDLDPARYDTLLAEMRGCAAGLFSGPGVSTELFFKDYFGQRMVHLLDTVRLRPKPRTLVLSRARRGLKVAAASRLPGRGAAQGLLWCVPEVADAAAAGLGQLRLPAEAHQHGI